MKLILGLSLVLLSSAAFACPGMDKEITFLPQKLQSPVLTQNQDQVDPKLLLLAEKKELKVQKTN